MKLSFRWYGLNDSIPLEYIRQIPNMSTIVTSVYDKKAGEVWEESSLLKLKAVCEKNGLKMEVIESIPVSEDIKMGTEKRDAHIEAFKKNLELCAKNGVKVVCYNFMPVFDWLRTDMHHVLFDGSNALSYSRDDFDKVDPKHLHLPGWDESYSPDELQDLLEKYKHISHEQLFANLVYFLNQIMPICDQYGISMAIHPDDPPWDVFGLPRIISNEEDLDKLFAAVPDIHNGLTLCTGSFGAGRAAPEKRTARPDGCAEPGTSGRSQQAGGSQRQGAERIHHRNHRRRRCESGDQQQLRPCRHWREGQRFGY